MSIADRLASALDRRDEAPNIALAEEIAANSDTKAVTELIGLLTGGSRPARHDAIKVLYETGGRNPALIAPHLDAFVGLLTTRDNRMLWGTLTALAAIAPHDPEAIVPYLEAILAAADNGSVIAKDKAMTILLALAETSAHRKAAWPLVLARLETAAPNQLPMYAEQAVPVGGPDGAALAETLAARLGDMPTPAKRKRVEKVIRVLTG
ncbi:hypothetical protein [Cucumibacter marinus]|uniref:hypothetical protein n=1 Tax=Cucumibacter marinus TaxID=1121252 RepID=UPI0004045E04|nr:hypothetical protein [Cucumibacter marinus]